MCRWPLLFRSALLGLDGRPDANTGLLALPQLGGTLAAMPKPVLVAGKAPAAAAHYRRLAAGLAGVQGERAQAQGPLAAVALPVSSAPGAPPLVRRRRRRDAST